MGSPLDKVVEPACGCHRDGAWALPSIGTHCQAQPGCIIQFPVASAPCLILVPARAQNAVSPITETKCGFVSGLLERWETSARAHSPLFTVRTPGRAQGGRLPTHITGPGTQDHTSAKTGVGALSHVAGAPLQAGLDSAVQVWAGQGHGAGLALQEVCSELQTDRLRNQLSLMLDTGTSLCGWRHLISGRG